MNTPTPQDPVAPDASAAPAAPATPATPTAPPPVLVHPPVLVAVVALVVGVLEWLMPFGFLAAFPRLPLMLVGLAGLISGVMLIVAAAKHMHEQGTNIPTFQPALSLVTDGVFAYSRNPIYLGLVTGMAGVALMLPSLWLLLGTGFTTLVLHHGVIKREEGYLRQHFGQAYEDYGQVTARWYGRTVVE